MSLINVTNVEILDNPTKFTNPFQFEITFECLPPGVQEELEWKLVYVGSAEDEKYDQELDSVLVGPVVVGKNKFVFQAPAPDPALIPAKDVMEVTVLLLTASYKDREFIRVGYYVNNDYAAEEVELHTARNAWLQQVATLQTEYQTALEAVRAQQESMQAAADAAIAAMAGGPAATGGMTLEAEQISLPEPPAPVLPAPPAVDISRLTRNILADKPRVTRFQIPWDQEQNVQEFAMDAADEAKAAAEAQLEPVADVGDATFSAQPNGAAAEEDEEEEEEDDEMDDEMDEEGEDEEANDNDEANMAAPGPQGMHVE